MHKIASLWFKKKKNRKDRSIERYMPNIKFSADCYFPKY